MFAIKFDGIGGPIACDADGEHGRSSTRRCWSSPADPKTFGVGKNPKKIWPLGLAFLYLATAQCHRPV